MILSNLGNLIPDPNSGVEFSWVLFYALLMLMLLALWTGLTVFLIVMQKRISRISHQAA
jgi:Tfp pilus assembly protein PilX